MTTQANLPSCTPAPRCRACGTLTQRTWIARERYAGMPGEFTYGECPSCAALSIAEIPSNLSEFYGKGYYSFSSKKPGLRQRFICGYHYNLKAALRSIPRRDSLVLDVGCGSGNLLKSLARHGYQNLNGTDPFLPSSMTGKHDGITLMNLRSDELTSTWEFVMYHHAFEHVSDPVREMNIAARLLAPGGRLLVRVPLADSWLYETYGLDWYQWDAPRHLWLPTRKAMRALARQAGLDTVEEWQDATLFPIIASRLYHQGLTLNAPRKNPLARRITVFRQFPRLIADWWRLRWTIRTSSVDQACFLFQKPH